MSEKEPIGSLESAEEKLTPEKLGVMFNTMDPCDFKTYLREELGKDPSKHFSIVADWKSKSGARFAKSLLDMRRQELNIDSITIRATRKQMEEDVNAFQSGVEWEEIKN